MLQNYRSSKASCLAKNPSAHPLARAISIAAVIVLSLFGMHVAYADTPFRTPDAIYIQAGNGEGAASATAGLIWEMGWQRQTALGLLTGYWDFSAGTWRSREADEPGAHHSYSTIGITPVIRLWIQDSSRFFVEAGIGANLIGPLYKRQDQRFSTAFNFGDHIAAGWRFGNQGREEISLRLQHYSNAGIKHPNPGVNFVQLRFAYRFE